MIQRNIRKAELHAGNQSVRAKTGYEKNIFQKTYCRNENLQNTKSYMGTILSIRK